MIFEAEVFYQNNGENLKKDVTEMLSNLEEEKLNEELEQKIQELRQTKNKESEIKLLKEINELNKKKENIKNGRLPPKADQPKAEKKK